MKKLAIATAATAALSANATTLAVQTDFGMTTDSRQGHLSLQGIGLFQPTKYGTFGITEQWTNYSTSAYGNGRTSGFEASYGYSIKDGRMVYSPKVLYGGNTTDFADETGRKTSYNFGSIGFKVGYMSDARTLPFVYVKHTTSLTESVPAQSDSITFGVDYKITKEWDTSAAVKINTDSTGVTTNVIQLLLGYSF